MPSKKQPTSMTYPSNPGSDVYRSASFWSLPSMTSTSACSDQSVQTQRSKDAQGRLKVLLDYPAHSENTRILEEADMWRAEKLRVKLSAMAKVCGEWENALAKSVSECQNRYETAHAADGEASKLQEGNDAALEAAAQKISDTMDEHGLTFDVVVCEESGTLEWTMFMTGVLVGKGHANTLNDLITAGFYENELKGVKVSKFYEKKYCL
ncbi:hypothetical protein J7T55_011720 [Diaporthe amygdali]|uniref:uncharacterized protein n=1 Tax=Phomopsis amygdali TaxID=1214568 RepID=UPI0022FE931A|nr:uncharacterized protein J7T55_011720 [Diaporthe amygdali]KAJ0123256.1 hypothetical protein J7T55_011720 [Diaporthe amygdali]